MSLSSLERAAVKAAQARFGGGGDPRYRFRKEPDAWLKERMREHAWTKQLTILESVRDNRRTVVRSCHDVGKSFIASRAVAWWLDTHPIGSAKVVTTAPTFQQVRAILWQEINKAHKRGGLAGRVNQTEWWVGDEQAAFGRKPSDHDTSAFVGIHARYVLVVIDEGDGVPEALYRDANSLIANEDSRILVIGNPDNGMSTHMAKIEQSDTWNLISISAFESPNFTKEVVPNALKHVLVNQSYIDEMEADYGVDSPIYRSKVLGERTEDDAYGVVPWSWIARCREQRNLFDATKFRDDVCLGVDVGASMGGDYTSIRERRGTQAGRTWAKRTWELDQQMVMLADAIDETGATEVVIDANGPGAGFESHARAVFGKKGIRVKGYMGGKAAKDVKKYANARTEMWWLFREGCRDRTWDLGAIDAGGQPMVHDKVLDQIRAPRWRYDKSRRVWMEAKEDTIDRIKRSPDDADAMMMAFIKPVAKTLELLGAA